MKKLIAITTMLGAVMTVPLNTKADMGACLKVSSMAGTTMEARQGGVPMDVVVKLLSDDDVGFTPTMQKAALNIIVDAYDYPKMSVEANQVEAKTEFAAKWLIKCLEISK